MSDEILSQSYARVQIVDAFNPSDEPRGGFLNPQTISYAMDVEIGELNPVGASHSVLQYGFTKSGNVPIELYFSTQLSPRIGALFADITYYSKWFASFCLPEQPGQAPHPLLIVWPEVMELVLVIKSYKANYVRFHGSTLQAAAIRVALETRELRMHFRGMDDMRRKGLKDPSSIVEIDPNTGQPMGFKHRR
jgi:hypothetical protein